jgi:hypothetical protein
MQASWSCVLRWCCSLLSCSSAQSPSNTCIYITKGIFVLLRDRNPFVVTTVSLCLGHFQLWAPLVNIKTKTYYETAKIETPHSHRTKKGTEHRVRAPSTLDPSVIAEQHKVIWS